ncbi:MAG: DUF2877 domain-containing protein [Candidatus Tenebribacter burtonii]|nr:DUF2877 domain-containing protein [Candidatus Tenebribacter burtonii]
MEILNFGSSIKNGNYILHSEFKNVHNYTNNVELISLVSTKIGAGPNNIVLNNFPLQAEQILTISNPTISIGNTALYIIPVELLSKEYIYINNISVLLSRIKLILNELSDYISPKSLGFLLFPDNENFFNSIFEKALLAHVKKTVQKISLENIPTIAKNMKGVGIGLTPSGDDFNCGILYALNYLNEILSKDFTEIIEACYLNSTGNNLISNTFLRYAFLNKYYENFHELLKALKDNDKLKISIYIKKIINTGHTSGSDMLSGFILTIKGVLNDKKYC